MAPTAEPSSPPPPRRPQTGPPPGLKNLGNTCYLNSVLQCLASTPPLATFCLASRHSNLCKKVFPNRDKECAFCVLERQIARLLRADAGALDSPGKIIRCMPLFADHFRWGRQEDAHEFLRYAVDACHTAGLRMRKRLPAAVANGNCGEEEGRGQGACMVMRETFGGALLSQVKCLVCKGESNKKDEIMDISLDLPGSTSVADALARFFQPEILEGANKYSCERCKKLTSARKQMFIFRAPKVLVIQLKRFEGINGGKINRNIEFKEALVLSDFMYNKNQDSRPVYSLFGCIVHSGLSPESGHYYAYVKDAVDRWFCCNDSHVSLSSSQNVLSEKVYILFYILNSKNQKPSTNGYSSTAAKSFSTNGIGISSTSSSETLKIPLVKQNGSCFTKGNVLLPLKNGKIASGPLIKPIHFKNSAPEKGMSNGKLNPLSKMDPEVNENTRPAGSNGHKTGKFAEPSKRNADGAVSCGEMDDHSEKILQDANGNGHLISSQYLGAAAAAAAASLIPGLPDDVAAFILCLLTFPDQSRLRATSRAWRLLLSAATLLPLRRSLRLPRRHLLCLFPTDPSLASPILLDPAAPTAWWPLPPLPCSPQLYGLANFAALAVGRHLYVLGGSCFDARSYPLGHPSPSAAAYRLNLAHSRHYWERLPDMQVPRGSFACAPAPSGGGVIVAGGGSRHPTFPSNGSRTDSTEWYDATARSWRFAASMPRDRAGCVGFVAHGAGDGGEDEFWVMGGYDGYTTVGGVVPNDVYCRNAVALGLWSGKWREIGNMWEEGERRRLGPVAALSADDGRITEVFMLNGNDVFRYDFASNRWLIEATTRRRIPDTESCGFVSMNGELYVLGSAKVPVEASGPWRQLKKKLALEFQVYNPGTKKWRVLTTYPPVHAPIDFRTAALCTVEL